MKNFFADKNNIEYLLEEMFYAKGIRTNYISQPGCTSDIEDIIKQYYIVNYWWWACRDNKKINKLKELTK